MVRQKTIEKIDVSRETSRGERMKAYLIDSKECTVTEVEHDDSIHDIYEKLDCRSFDAVRLDNDDTIYVDDEGLYQKHTYFVVDGMPNPLAGNGLVLGTDLDGYSTDPTYDISTITDMIRFIDFDEALRMAEQLDDEGRAQERKHREQGGIGFMYMPIAGILKAARYTEESS